MYLPSAEIRQKLIRLGASSSRHNLPAILDPWFEGVTEDPDWGTSANACAFAPIGRRFTVVPKISPPQISTSVMRFATFWGRA